MPMVQHSRPTVYEWGTARADDGTPAALTYEPLGTAAPAASEPWTADDRAEWLAAELADMRRENGGGW